jgi:hypothetical protein
MKDIEWLKTTADRVVGLEKCNRVEDIISKDWGKKDEYLECQI